MIKPFELFDSRIPIARRGFVSADSAVLEALPVGSAYNPWVEIKDADRTALELFRRHYSYNRRRDQLSLFAEGNRNKNHFVGPGQKMVLLAADALFVWRKFISQDGQQGVNCAVFRNESREIASALILAAEVPAWDRWPGERLYTYVNPRKVRRSRTPGRCFLKAGWRYVRDEKGRRALTKSRQLLILEKLAEWK